MWWDGYWHGPWLFGPFFMLLLVAFCAAAIVLMLRGMSGGHGSRSRAIDTLKERFARGEITQAQYEEQRRIIEA